MCIADGNEAETLGLTEIKGETVKPTKQDRFKLWFKENRQQH